MIFFRNNVWRILPLAAAILLWTIGYVFRFYEPLATSVCDSFYGEYCMSAIGVPLLAIGQWLVASAVVILFARFETVKRWSIFAAVYLVVTTAVLAFSPVSSGGIGFQERLTIANLFGVLFLIVTVLWVIIHAIVLRRRKGAQ